MNEWLATADQYHCPNARINQFLRELQQSPDRESVLIEERRANALGAGKVAKRRGVELNDDWRLYRLPPGDFGYDTRNASLAKFSH